MKTPSTLSEAGLLVGPVECVAHGWERESWPLQIDQCSGSVGKLGVAGCRLIWWWDINLTLHTSLVNDDAPEPTFRLVEAPFRVAECSRRGITTERRA